ncbi:MAG: Na+/H+ antiporter subunit G [Candidatus Abyssobacteria bacterium SURF_5]|uniref:Na+/H+ antiporter subunit G n=1 Tax=Abyssobacteria bacterium (strain SURF_5) TaxID=2093360 RepID=A0A3A4NYZ4_ABYX5|nr:MAG: Na+/H+ antiporter subunit G [Candidatus Abyssubacteria bacterium SURF_5]
MQQAMSAVFMFIGACLMLISGLGIIRFPDLYMRISASTKASTLGAGFALFSLAVHFGRIDVAMLSFATIAFLLITVPVAAHLLSRAAYHVGVPLWERSVIDELGGGQNGGYSRTGPKE